MKKRRIRKLFSFLLAAAITISSLSAVPYGMVVAKGSQGGKKEGISYAFTAETIVAEEIPSEDAKIQIRIKRSGNISEPSNMVLLSYDINADYGEDYILAYHGKEFQKADSVTSMYAAFRDNRVISDYEEDNKAFVDALLSTSGLSLEGENVLVPSDTAGHGQSEEGDTTKNLTDADADGVNLYDSLSTLEKIGAASARTILSFDAGEETKEITLTVQADELVEYDESFLLGIVSSQVDEYLQQHIEGIPDIPLKQGRDIAVASVTIEDSSQENPECTVHAEQAEYAIEDGKDTVPVSFGREGFTDTFSTVMVRKDGEAYGYFYFSPYQEVQQAELEAGNYEILANQNCVISGEKTITVTKGTDAVEKKKSDVAKVAAASDSDHDLDTVYEYDALPDSGQSETGQDETSQTEAGQEKSKTTASKKTAKKNAAPTWPNGNPEWFPEWANNNGITETADYITYGKQGTALFNKTNESKYSKGFSYGEYIKDKKKEHKGKNVYNTYRLDTSGTFSNLQTNMARAYTCTETTDASWHTTQTTNYYDMTGIESVETRYYADDSHFNITLGVSGVNEQVYKNVSSKGTHDVIVTIPTNDTKGRYIYFQNDNCDIGVFERDGARVFIMNAFKLNKRTYQVAVDNSNKLEFVTKSGDIEQVAAESVSKDQYSYMKMGDTEGNDININLSMYDNYPMVLTGYQFVNKEGGVIDGTYVQSTSGQIRFNKDFLKNYVKYCFTAKREDRDESYSTFRLQPVVSKIPVEEFKILNGSKDSAYNPYRGELVLENKSEDLYQGDHVTLSAKDIQEGYTFSGVYIKRRKTESADWQTMMHSADSSGKVVFRLDADYSYYQVEPVFSGHEADTVTISYADDASNHGSLTADGQSTSMVTLVSPEEYQINSYVPLVANPQDGYVTCWYSGNRTYYGNTFYYQMDGNSKHNDIVVDFLKKSDVQTTSVNLDLSVYENQVNLRNSSVNADPVPLTDMQFVTTSGKTCQGMTDSGGKAQIEEFEGVIGGTYSMILYRPGENRYRYVEYEFTGKKSCDIKVPAFAGMSAYPDKVTARIDGTSANQSYIDLSETGEVEITVEVYRPDISTTLGAVGLSFYYQGEDGMAKQDYTIEHPDQAEEEEEALGVYDTYTLKVSAAEIPNLSYLYVDVKSSYEVMETREGTSSSEAITVECDTGYVNTGYKFKTPNESSELAILEEVPELPGIGTTGEDVSIPYIGSLDFGFTAKNGAYFVRKDDPNTGTWYLLAGYNVVSTWPKTLTDRYTGASKTAEALIAAEEQSRAVGDINGGGSNLVKIPGSTVVNVAPALSLKFVMQDAADGGYQVVGFDAIIGLDELIVYNAPFTIYGVPCYVNLTFNGEEFYEVHAGGSNFDRNGVENAILDPSSDTDVTVFIQAPNLDLTVKTGVGFNAFAGVYLSLGGNLKFDLEHSDKWKAGGYFYIKGGLGVDLAVFSIEETVNIPGSGNQAFGNDEARGYIHSATTSLSDSSPVAEKGAAGIMKSVNKSMDATDRNPVFTLSRYSDQSSGNTSEEDSGQLSSVLKPAGKNVKMQLVKLSGKKVMAITLADNGAAENSLNYLDAVYAVSDDGGKTWNRKENISDSGNLQWNVNCYQLKDKILLTWSEGNLDNAVDGEINAQSEFDLATVAKALTAFDLKGRYFDLEGNPLGDSFAIASDETAAINSLDAVENTDGTVDLYYERRAYSKDTATLTELMTQEQTICKTVLNDQGKTETEDKRFLVQSQDGSQNYRVTELKAFSYKGIDGQVVVLDEDGKLVQETEDGAEASIDDRRIYLRITSDANGNIPADTLIPMTEEGSCAQRISLIENEEHMYLLWNQNGSIVSAADFLPTTQEEYEEWKDYAGSFGCHTLLSDEKSLTTDTEFRAAMNENGKGILLWKGSEGRQYSDDSLGSQIYAGTYTTDENGSIESSRGPILLSSLVSEINNLDVQVLDDGTVLYGCTQLDGMTMYESNSADAVVENVEETQDVQITRADSEDYPLPGEAYTSYVTLWNNGMSDAEDLVLSVSGALCGQASLADMIREEEGEEDTANGDINAGQVRRVMLPVTAADSIQDGDEVIYTLSQNDTVLSTFRDTVHRGAYMVPQEMASVISIPGTDDYQISLTVVNQGNQEGTTDVHSYTFDQGVQTEAGKDTQECDYQDETLIQPGGTAEISYIMKGAAYQGDTIRMIGVQTGDGYEQIVEGMLPDRIEAMEDDSQQPENPNNPEKPGNSAEPANTPQPTNTAPSNVLKKGDVVVGGSDSTRAGYRIISGSSVSYYKSQVPSGKTSAKVPNTVKISGKTYKVTAIDAGAFQGNKKLKKITVGKNVSKIPAKAFYQCKALQTIVLQGVTSIGSKAFYGCTALKTAKLGSKLLSIGTKAFYRDKKLSTVTISSKKLKKIGSYAFYGCKKLKTLTIKSSKLKKKSVKNALKGSRVQSIVTTSSLRKKYKKYFTKKNAGRKVTIRS